jgi:type VI protein secretion system component VasK
MQAALLFLLAVAALLLAAPQSAEAYIGPGAGITAIGTVIALIGAILLAIVGFVWYPIKRLRAKNRKKEKTDEEAAPS